MKQPAFFKILAASSPIADASDKLQTARTLPPGRHFVVRPAADFSWTFRDFRRLACGDLSFLISLKNTSKTLATAVPRGHVTYASGTGPPRRACRTRLAQAEFDTHKPTFVVGSSRGGAVAMNVKIGDARLVLLCPAWKK